MLVTYKGGQSALRVDINGRLVQLPAGKQVLLTKDKAGALLARRFIKNLVKLKVLETQGVDSLSKAELVNLATAHGYELTGKEKVSDLTSLLQGIEPVVNDLDPNLDLDPAE